MMTGLIWMVPRVPRAAAMVRSARCSRAPCASRDGGPEAPQIGYRERERALLLRAAVGGHEHLYDTDAVVEGEPRCFLAEKGAGEVPVLRLVAVHHRLRRHHGHHSRLGVLLLHEILAGPTLHRAREEHAKTGIERVPLH